MVILILLVPLFFSLVFLAFHNKKWIEVSSSAGAVILFILSLLITAQVLEKSVISFPAFNGMFYIDALSALMLNLITAVFMFVAMFSVGYIGQEYARKEITFGRVKLFYSLLHGFVFTMILVVTSQNMGIIWIAVEATTLTSAFLVGFYNNKKSIEAAWKYIIICSVGIAFALLGIILLYYSSVSTFHQNSQGMNWSFLFQNADKLQGSILKISFIFILVGFGTKVGFAPMHTWLPDAHSQAPAPVSALLSGVLLSVALYPIIRVITIVNRNLQSSLFTGKLLMALGLISIALAAVFIIVQQDYKKLLAYSSVEHMGIIALGLGMFTPLSIFGALFHILNHALTKSLLFLASGNVYIKFHTRKITKISALLKLAPVTGTVFLLAIFAIVGMPPFSIFASEFAMIAAAFENRLYFTGILFLVLLSSVFAGFMVVMPKMFYGTDSEKELPDKGEPNRMGAAVITVMLAFILITGVFLPNSLRKLLTDAVGIITGGSM